MAAKASRVAASSDLRSLAVSIVVLAYSAASSSPPRLQPLLPPADLPQGIGDSSPLRPGHRFPDLDLRQRLIFPAGPLQHPPQAVDPRLHRAGEGDRHPP